MVSRKKKHGARGFTLVEIMLVVLIIGILSSVAIPGMFKMTARARRAEMSTALSKMRTYFVNLYENQGNFCPPDLGLGNCSPTGAPAFTSVINPTAAVPIGQNAPWDPKAPGWVSIPFYSDGTVQMRYTFTANGNTLTLSAYGSFPGYPTIANSPVSYNYLYQETYQGVTLATTFEAGPTF